VNIPVLRKDFLFDPYQVYEARANGADAFLLIAAMLEASRMADLYMLGRELGMEVLAEVHDEHDLEKVLECGFYVVGINNRNLQTFEVDIKTTERLMSGITYDKVIVSESGIWTPDDIRYLKKTGADAALIGESLMREADFGKKLKELADTRLRQEEK
ncbi:MAG TPA: indole-3-glycerol phosphate synthase TrpC, partial [Nitrospirota bacterium]